MNHVIIAGNIGTGKTTAARLLGALVQDAQVIEESKGLFLERYYENPAFAFLNQLDYTIQYFEQARQIMAERSKSWLFQDRSVLDTHQVFTRMLFKSGSISLDEFSLLDRLNRLASEISQPRLLVLLDADPNMCLDRIRHRGDPEERLVKLSHLELLRSEYLSWFEAFDQCPKSLINTEQSDRKEVAEKIIRFMEQTVGGVERPAH